MAQTVKLKRSNVLSKVPLVSDLDLGELSLNTRDGLAWTVRDTDGTGTNNELVELVTSNWTGKIIGSPLHSAVLQNRFDHTESGGITDGADLTDNLNGSINLSAGEAYIRALDDSHSTLWVVEFGATTNLTLINHSLNIVYLDYDAGALTLKTTDNPALITITDKIPAYYIYREDNVLHVRDIRYHNVDNTAKHQKHMFFTEREVRSQGAVLSDAGTLHIAVSASDFYFQLNLLSSTAFDTSGTDTFRRFYRDGIGGFTEQPLETTIDNIYYDDGDGTLGTIGIVKYAVEWIYLVLDDSHTANLYSVYGRESFGTVSDAQAEQPYSDLPGIISTFGTLIGKVISQQGNTEILEVQSAFDVEYTSSLAEYHNNLAGLNLGDYQHLTAAELTVVQNTSGTNTGDQSATDILTSIKTVDGTGSGLDADLLDGEHGAFYAPIDSPALTGVPTSPTAVPGTSTVQLATTAFVAEATSGTSTTTRVDFTATAGQTLFTTPYNPTGVDVFAGGVKIDSDLYTSTTGTSITLDFGVDEGTWIQVVSNSSAPIGLPDFGVTATAPELNVLDGILASTAELNILDGVTATTAELNILDGVTATTAELNILDGVTTTAIELNVLDGYLGSTISLNYSDALYATGVTSTEYGYLDGVTSGIQGQLDLKAPLASPSLTGVPIAPTAAINTNTTQLATTAFVVAEVADYIPAPAFPADEGLSLVARATGNDWEKILGLPLETGNKGMSVTNNGVEGDSFWSYVNTNPNIMTADQVMAIGTSASVVDGFTIADGVTLTIPDGSVLSIV